MLRTKSLLPVAMMMSLIAASLTTSVALANDGQPPATPTPGQPPLEQVTAEVTTRTTLQGPRGPSKSGEVLPNTVLPGPGGESGILTSRLSYYYSWPSWWMQGSATIDLTGSPTAKAWTTLEDNGGTVESTAGHPCWTYTSCTSSTGWWGIAGGHTGGNRAETVVFWSAGGNAYADAYVSHTF